MHTRFLAKRQCSALRQEAYFLRFQNLDLQFGCISMQCGSSLGASRLQFVKDVNFPTSMWCAGERGVQFSGARLAALFFLVVSFCSLVTLSSEPSVALMLILLALASVRSSVAAEAHKTW